MPTLPYEVGSQGGVALGGPTKAPEKKTVKTVVLGSKLGGDLVAIKSVDDEARFEAEYQLNKGSTENAYLFSADKTALIDIPEGAWAEAFAKELKKNLGSRSLDYLILGHFNPRLGKTLAAVLDNQPDTAPPVEIWCSNPAKRALTAMLSKGHPAFSRELYTSWKRKGLRARLLRVKTGDSLDIGQGHNFSFFLAPTPRWAEGLFVYDSMYQKLFTSKFFGAHVVSKSGFDSDGDYQEDWDYYFNSLVGPVATQAKSVMERASICPVESEETQKSGGFRLPAFYKLGSGMKKLASFFAKDSDPSKEAADDQTGKPSVSSGIAVATICPRHGPVVRQNLKALLDSYDAGIADRLSRKEDFSVAVVYASAYGNTGVMANAVSNGLTKAGINVKLLDCEFSTNAEVADLVKGCQGFAVGSPTLGGHIPTPVSEAIGAILKNIDRNTPYGVFGSYGWSGEAVPAMSESLKDGGFLNQAFDPVSLKFKPTDDLIELLESNGERLAQSVKGQLAAKKIKQRKALAEQQIVLAEDDRVRAVGHIPTSVTAITSHIREVDSIMLCSWISQASFNPPAITLSISKKNSPEGLFLLNSKFIVNVLGAGKEKGAMKLLNKGFRSGNDCFEGYEIERDETTNCAMLKDAASYMKCTVTDRMDTGDHWLLLATIEDGKVLDAKSPTFFHHRRTGSQY